MSWSRVQGFSVSTEFNSDASASTAKALTSAVAVGDCIKIRTTVGADPASLTLSTVTDQLGNVYTKLSAANGGQQYDGSNTQGWDTWECIVTVAGTPTITYTPSGTQAWIGFVGDHFTGSDASSTRRDSKGIKQIFPGTGTDAIATASIGASSGDLVWAATAASNTSTAIAVGTGFTAGTFDTTLGIRTEYKTASGAGAATFTDATNGGGSIYGTVGVATTPASGVVNNTQTPSGFGLTMNLGTPAVAIDAILQAPTGFSPPMSLGSPNINTNSNVTLTPSGFPLSFSLGTFDIQIDTTITGIAGFSVPFSLGTPSTSTSGNVSFGPNGFSLPFSLGTPIVPITSTLTPTGFPVPFSLGTPTISSGSNPTLQPVGFLLGMALGSPLVTGATSSSTFLNRVLFIRQRRRR